MEFCQTCHKQFLWSCLPSFLVARQHKPLHRSLAWRHRQWPVFRSGRWFQETGDIFWKDRFPLSQAMKFWEILSDGVMVILIWPDSLMKHLLLEKEWTMCHFWKLIAINCFEWYLCVCTKIQNPTPLQLLTPWPMSWKTRCTELPWVQGWANTFWLLMDFAI